MPRDAANESLVVETSYGKVRGTRDGSTRRWLGIPYAAAPVGERRFRAPQSPSPWEGVRDAVVFGDAAPQEPTHVIPLPPGVSISEDCLNLNVWAPLKDSAESKPKPVMVWIHGGAYFIGFSAQPTYDGRALAENGDVVVVTLNYRLGALGFLDFSSFSEGSNVFESNLGLRDIVAALKWVRDNIAAFGGDPSDVTLFGESAGGGCVTTLMTSPAAEGLFHRAIAQSSPATSVYKVERARQVALQYLDLLGVSADKASGTLRELDAITLASCTMKLLNHVATTAPGTVAFAPVVDGDLIPDYPVKMFRAGKAARIPLIIGTNHDEAAFFKMMKSPLMPITGPSIREMFRGIATEDSEVSLREPDIVAAYPTFPRQRAAMNISRDAGFRLPSIWVAEAHSRYAPTWMYRFDVAPPLMKVLGLGASHGAELPYVFGTLPRLFSKRSLLFRLGGLRVGRKISRRVQARWLSFATTGNPSTVHPDASHEMPWPRYEVPLRSTLIINKVDRVDEDPDGASREAWGSNVIAFT